MNRDTKSLAIKYRKEGDSYSEICKKLKISKSTLCDWVKHIPFVPNLNTLQRIKHGPIRSAEVRHTKKLKQIEAINLSAVTELGEISKRDLWMFGLGLYLGEGAKSIESVRIINSDPKVITIAIAWLTKVVGLSVSNLKLALHTYPDNDPEKDVEFWANITGVPKTQFGKTQIDVRTGKKGTHKLPHGTVQLRVVSRGEVSFGVSLHRRITSWIESVANQSSDLL